MLVLSGCSVEEVLRFGWPEGITDRATSMRELWTGSTLAALAVGAVTWGAIFWACLRYRRRSDDLPRQTAYNLPVEITFVVIPFLIIGALFYFTVVSQNVVLAQSDDPDVTVDVTGFQWNWRFQYPEAPVTDTADVVTTVGNDVEVPILVLPAGQTVRFNLASNDVIHSFWVPDFLFKRDVIPGINVGYDNDFEVTLAEDAEGAYVGRCAELCGIYHYAMNFEVRVVSPADFEDYLQARQGGDSNAAALDSIGQSPIATSTSPFDTDRTRRSATN
ncbi:MAG: cytochrome c oxidase subunit II [Geodermatophilaceae bacterium]|nr:cytochrome c oxidase subunit II [Geodermatophilaceae bacterium]